MDFEKLISINCWKLVASAIIELHSVTGTVIFQCFGASENNTVIESNCYFRKIINEIDFN